MQATMDGALSSSRYDQPDRQNRHYRNDRRDHRRHHPYGRGGGRGGPPRRGGGRFHSSHHRDNRRGPRRPRQPGNRFGGASTTSIDPQTAMLRQLGALLGKVGELQTPPEGKTIVDTISQNISDLSLVLCSKDNAPQFLKFQAVTETTNDVVMESTEAPSTPKADEEAGALAHLVISTVSTLPLQTPSYAGLTLSVNELAPKPEFACFADRCVTYGMRHVSRDLDVLLLNDGRIPEDERSRTFSRLVHVLRYLALLGRLNIVLGHEEEDTMGTTRTEEMSLAGLLQTLTHASVKAASLNHLPTACLLAQLVVSTLPYVQGTIPKDFVTEQLLDPLESNVINAETYKSAFAPGSGSLALLLKEEQAEGLDDEEDEEDDDDEEEDESGQRCDTLQDLFRSVKLLSQSEEKATEFSLLTDAPWVGLNAPFALEPSEDGNVPPQVPMTFSDESIRLSFSKDCKSVPFLVAESDDRSVELQCFDLNGIVFGRLPIFGSPPEDNDDEDDEEDEEMETTKNEQLQAYQTRFGLLDRYFLADAVRDCLLNHQSHVSDAGLERGSAKDVAQQLWTISHLFSQKGVEYGIIEAILSLIMQARNEGAFRNLFLSRVLLELTRLQPSIMPQALALAVSNSVSYYLPALVPSARDNFSRWFSFHLLNTDYQWPSGYWQHWANYVTNAKRNSRSDFVLRTLSLMESQLSDVSSLVTECLPSGSVLAKYLLPNDTDNEAKADSSIMTIERDLDARIWEKNEDPDSLREYVIGDELSETILGANTDKKWVRTCATVRALLHPATKQYAGQREAIERVVQPSEESAMEQDDSDLDDVLVMLTENLVRYRPMLLAALARDAESIDKKTGLQGQPTTEAGEQLVTGGTALLKEMENRLQYSRVLLETCIACIVENHIVSGEAILRWALDNNADDGNAVILVKRWWEFAEIAIRIGIVRALAEMDAGEEMGGMVIDRGDTEPDSNSESPAALRMKAITTHICPVLQYATRRVCTLLQEADDGKKKLAPDTVDLVDGLKLTVLGTKTIVLSKLIDSPSSTAKEAHDLWSKSSICGSELASIAQERSSCFAIDTLTTLLQGI